MTVTIGGYFKLSQIFSLPRRRIFRWILDFLLVIFKFNIFTDESPCLSPPSFPLPLRTYTIGDRTRNIHFPASECSLVSENPGKVGGRGMAREPFRRRMTSLLRLLVSTLNKGILRDRVEKRRVRVTPDVGGRARRIGGPP